MQKLADPLEVPLEPSLEPFKIGSMEIYQFDCLLIKKLIPQITNECSCGLLKISSNGLSGWEECILPSSEKRFDLIHWASVFLSIKGLPIAEAIAFVHKKREAWGQERCEVAKSALDDLVWHIKNPNAVKLQKTNGIVLERSFLIEQSRSYYSF
ncbi:hypothetical protein [Paenibacillus agricola]|uniref:Uncharacterized protein n=1 Tax=Paenibacillus agricola TaxID=2716264 RepID=A0ABX0JCY8_9BACL|nr:hypothetical protein [Paenibacillus agricola]NHN33651.1 hypothetical protein [Paenibacillus agricola]